MLGRYGFGWLSDLVNKKWLLFILYIFQPMASSRLFGCHYPGYHSLCYWFIHSLWREYGVRATLIGDYYGRKNFGTIFGVIDGISTFGGIAGPLIAGPGLRHERELLPGFHVLCDHDGFCSSFGTILETS